MQTILPKRELVWLTGLVAAVRVPVGDPSHGFVVLAFLGCAAAHGKHADRGLAGLVEGFDVAAEIDGQLGGRVATKLHHPLHLTPQLVFERWRLLDEVVEEVTREGVLDGLVLLVEGQLFAETLLE
jgi:hypothetical protein